MMTEREMRDMLATLVVNRAIERLLPEALKPFVEEHGREVDWLGMHEYVEHAGWAPTLVASMRLAAHVGGVSELIGDVSIVELLVYVPRETRSAFATALIMLESATGL